MGGRKSQDEGEEGVGWDCVSSMTSEESRRRVHSPVVIGITKR